MSRPLKYPWIFHGVCFMPGHIFSWTERRSWQLQRHVFTHRCCARRRNANKKTRNKQTRMLVASKQAFSSTRREIQRRNKFDFFMFCDFKWKCDFHILYHRYKPLAANLSYKKVTKRIGYSETLSIKLGQTKKLMTNKMPRRAVKTGVT